jgi:hypothetical protein
MSSHDDFGITDEEGIRFQKALAHCRICGHAKMTHSLIQNRCIDCTLNVKGKHSQCKCKKFLPTDNLEFLEYKYDEKKKRK